MTRHMLHCLCKFLASHESALRCGLSGVRGSASMRFCNPIHHMVESTSITILKLKGMYSSGVSVTEMYSSEL